MVRLVLLSTLVAAALPLSTSLSAVKWGQPTEPVKQQHVHSFPSNCSTLFSQQQARPSKPWLLCWLLVPEHQPHLSKP